MRSTTCSDVNAVGVDPSGLFSRIRASCAEVAAGAGFVRIHQEVIPAYARSLPVDKILNNEPLEQHYLGHGDDTLSFILVLDSINFGSGYSPGLRKRPGLGFYASIAAALKDYYRKFGAPELESLANIGVEQCFEIFGQDKANPTAFELMELFSQALRDLGRFTLERYSGSFPHLIAAAGNSAAKLTSILAEMPFFRDVHEWKGKEVAFLKRAQITATDLAFAFNDRGYGYFQDVDELTMFADNGVPQILVREGLMSYRPELAARIQRGEFLTCGSQEEIEIRACALHTVELLTDALGAAGTPVPARLVDYHLWLKRQEPGFKSQGNLSHRTRCVFY